jgi:myosin heavy subunit
VKPNEKKQKSLFVSKNCMEQLTYSGVFEAVSIRKQGFPFRLTHVEFARRYACVCNDYQAVLDMTPAQKGCEAIISEMQLNMDNVQVGLTPHASECTSDPHRLPSRHTVFRSG